MEAALEAMATVAGHPRGLAPIKNHMGPGGRPGVSPHDLVGRARFSHGKRADLG